RPAAGAPDKILLVKSRLKICGNFLAHTQRHVLVAIDFPQAGRNGARTPDADRMNVLIQENHTPEHGIFLGHSLATAFRTVVKGAVRSGWIHVRDSASGVSTNGVGPKDHSRGLPDIELRRPAPHGTAFARMNGGDTCRHSRL